MLIECLTENLKSKNENIELKKFDTILIMYQYSEAFYILYCFLTKINKMSLGKCLLGNGVVLISVIKKKSLDSDELLILHTFFHNSRILSLRQMLF